jgi:hypothetical protein
MKTEVKSNNGYKAMVWVEGADDLVGFDKPRGVTKEQFLADLPLGQPLPPQFEVRKFGEAPWMWVPASELVDDNGNHPNGPVKSMVTGAKLKGRDHIATTDDNCNAGCRNEEDGAWHDYPCPHFLEAIEQDTEMLYNPVTGQLTPAASKAVN